jgi:hypothetical protein
LLADNGVSIDTLSLADTERFGILRLTIREWEQVKAILADGDFVVHTTELIGIEVKNHPADCVKFLRSSTAPA